MLKVQKQKVRRNIARRNIQPLVGKTYKCKDARIRKVKITRNSVSEVADKAKHSKRIVKATKHIPEAIKKARYVKSTKPKNNNTQKRKFKTVEMKECKTNIKKLGKFKMRISTGKSGLNSLYSITDIKKG